MANWHKLPEHVTQPLILEKLKIARGDIFVAAGLLGCAPRLLRAAIKSSEPLQALYLALERHSVDPEFTRLSNKEYADKIAELTEEYRYEGLQAIHDIATIPLVMEQVVDKETGDTAELPISAAMMEVKLKAAIQLRGMDVTNRGSDSTSILAELNELYRQNAPRLKAIRTQSVQLEFHEPETPVHFQLIPESSETLIESSDAVGQSSPN